MNLRECLTLAVEKNASDVFIRVGRCVSFKIDGIIDVQNGEPVTPAMAEAMITELYQGAQRSMNKYRDEGDDDFSMTIPRLARFRVNAYRQRGTMAAVIRVVPFGIPDSESLHIPEEVMRIAQEKNGLVLVSGAAGSGKTTTLACIIDTVNRMRNCHIITLEDPIEFLHRDNMSLVSQREVSIDTGSYLMALRSCLRQAPDIILLGEMRDHETIRTAMSAAETGHLVISTLHTMDAVHTIDRVIDVFPPEQQHQVRVQLSMVLKTVVSQQLLPDASGGRVPAFEIMKMNSGIRNLIRESKTHQIGNILQTSSAEGMISMDDYILGLAKNGDVTKETALAHAINPEQIARRLAPL